MKLPGTRGRRCPSFSPARRCSAVFRDHFVSPTPASPYINTLCLYRCPEGAVDAPGPAAVSAGRPPSLRREAGGLNLAGGARAGPGSGGDWHCRPCRPLPGRHMGAGEGSGWREAGPDGGVRGGKEEGRERAAPVTWRVALLERGEPVKRTRARVGLEKCPLLWAPPVLWRPGGSRPSVAPGAGG